MNVMESLREAFHLYQKGELEAALILANNIINQYPTLAKAYQLIGMIFMKAGDYHKAYEAYLRAVKLTSEDPEIYNSLGNYFKTTGQFDEAKQSFENALKLKPNYVQAITNLGELYLKHNDPINAAIVFNSALGVAPDSDAAKRGLLYAYKDSNQRDAALKIAKQVSPSSDISYTLGQLHMEQGDIEKSRRAFQQAVQQSANATSAFRNLIQLQWMNFGRDAAYATVEEGLRQDGRSLDFFITAADILLETGQVDDALRVLDDAESRFGAHSDIDHVRANIHIEQNEAEPAFQLSQKIIASSPNSPVYISAFVRAALMVGEFESALNASQSMLEIYPNNQFFAAILATSLKALGRDDAGLLDYSRLVQSYQIEPPDGYENREEFLAKLKEELDRLHTHKNHPIGQSLRQGSQTSTDLRFESSKVIQDFFRALERPLQNYMKHIGTDTQHLLTRRNRQTYRVTGAWSVRLSGKGYHVNHVHPEGWISSAFYVDVPEGTAQDPNRAGWIKFGEPPFPVKGVSAEHWVAPSPGQLVLFPSYMWHGTVPIHDNATRMTLPFDAVPK